MRRFFAIALTLLRSGIHGLRSSPVTSAVAVLTIAVALLLGGAFGLLVANMGDVLERFGDELQVTAYLDEGLSPEAQRSLTKSAATVEASRRRVSSPRKRRSSASARAWTAARCSRDSKRIRCRPRSR